MSQMNRGPAPAPAGNLPGVKNVIAVGAGKGGVGKSTASVLLALGLVRRGMRVGLLDADIYGPSIPSLLGVRSEKPEVIADTQQMQPVESNGVKLISIGFMIEPEQAVVWRGPMVHGVVQQFLNQVNWGELDCLIVDLPPGTGDVPLTLAQSIPMTGAVVVCTPQDIALLDARRAVRMYEALNVPSLGIIENMSYYICPKCGNRDEIFDCGGAEQAAGGLGVPFLGALPLNGAVRKFCDDGTPAKCFTDAGDQVAAGLDKVVSSLVNQLEARNAAGNAAPTITIE
ncbi:MAG: Mrp/NBP35 family ATP-binding protein [Phycisphaerales bacterium]|nr:Mrp/NBP35 family ATP-binding protein [Phycisphaerales bacterium]